MKKRLQGIIAGLLAGVMLTGGIAYAKDISEKAQIYFRNIKIFIDGGEIVPKGSDGSVVEPFIMNGTTYLPVRAVAEALGKDVAWDGKTSTVYIGKKDQLQPDNYLDRIQYNDYKEGNIDHNFAIIDGNITDYSDKIYTNGLIFWDKWGDDINDEPDSSDIIIGYPLNSQYSKLTGKIVIPKSYAISSWEKDSSLDASSVDVLIYGDDELLYKAVYVTSSMPFSFDIDVRGVNQLYIKLNSADTSHIALTDLALYE